MLPLFRPISCCYISKVQAETTNPAAAAAAAGAIKTGCTTGEITHGRTTGEITRGRTAGEITRGRTTGEISHGSRSHMTIRTRILDPNQ